MERKRWTDKEDAILAQGIKENHTFSSISAKLEYRSPHACRKRMKVLGLDFNEIPDEPLRPAPPPPLTSLQKDMMLWQGAKFQDSINAVNEKTFANGMDIPLASYSFVGCAARMAADLGTGEGTYNNFSPEKKKEYSLKSREKMRAKRASKE